MLQIVRIAKRLRLGPALCGEMRKYIHEAQHSLLGFVESPELCQGGSQDPLSASFPAGFVLKGRDCVLIAIRCVKGKALQPKIGCVWIWIQLEGHIERPQGCVWVAIKH